MGLSHPSSWSCFTLHWVNNDPPGDSKRKTVQLGVCNAWLGGKVWVTGPASIKSYEIPWPSSKTFPLTHLLSSGPSNLWLKDLVWKDSRVSPCMLQPHEGKTQSTLQANSHGLKHFPTRRRPISVLPGEDIVTSTTTYHLAALSTSGQLSLPSNHLTLFFLNALCPLIPPPSRPTISLMAALVPFWFLYALARHANVAVWGSRVRFLISSWPSSI